ncbi:hypothetical protein [Bradyrhizobium neotropicale]|uniref:hypothetical protein n=1 Tax=Bradyrhizobium neotropicale TaxID=1497615 RepID=UPI000A754E72|nr:hypothetical protein [Bradyrhizobium neotropicale]
MTYARPVGAMPAGRRGKEQAMALLVRFNLLLCVMVTCSLSPAPPEPATAKPVVRKY